MRAWGFVILLLPCLLQAEGWVLVNEAVPDGKPLAKGYREIHPDATMKVINLDLNPMESIGVDKLASIRGELVKAKGEGEWPEWALSVFGMPLKIETPMGPMGFDAWLSCLPFSDYQPGKLVFNPDFYPKGPKWKPIRVCRLDGPALRHAQSMLVSWSRLEGWGAFRRCFPYDDKGVTASLLRSAGHLVQPREETFLVREDEIQFWECRDNDLLSLKEVLGEGKLPPGAIIFRYHNTSQKDGAFRPAGKSSASVASTWGASFFVGAMAPLKVEADLCDAQIFLTKYLRGETFASSIYSAAPNLGGSLLILGDPLANPYHHDKEKVYEGSFMKAQQVGDDPEVLKEMAKAKDWWLVKDYLQLWEKARFEMVLATLRVAIEQRESPIFYELLLRCRYQFGGKKEVEKVWQAWPTERKEAWEFAFYKGLMSED